MSTVSYSIQLDMAMERTRAAGLSPGKLGGSRVRRILTSQHSAALGTFIAEVVQEAEFTPGTIAAQCARITLAMKPHVKLMVGIEPLLTIGSVTVRGSKVGPTIPDMTLASLKTSESYHVWLTLPSMEVVDLTLLASLAARAGANASAIRSIATMSDAEPLVKWYPLFTGDEAVSCLLQPST